MHYLNIMILKHLLKNARSFPVPGMKGFSIGPRGLDFLLHQREGSREVADDLCLIPKATSHLLNDCNTKQGSLLQFFLFNLPHELPAESHGKELTHVY